MKMYLAKRNIIMLSDPETIIYKGQLFLLEHLEDLPDFNYMYSDELDPETASQADWQEMASIARSIEC